MDAMRIGSKFMKNVLSKLARKVISKKTGYEVDIRFNDIDMHMCNEKVHVHLSVDAELTKEELTKILKAIGLD